MIAFFPCPLRPPCASVYTFGLSPLNPWGTNTVDPNKIFIFGRIPGEANIPPGLKPLRHISLHLLFISTRSLHTHPHFAIYSFSLSHLSTCLTYYLFSISQLILLESCVPSLPHPHPPDKKKPKQIIRVVILSNPLSALFFNLCPGSFISLFSTSSSLAFVPNLLYQSLVCVFPIWRPSLLDSRRRNQNPLYHLLSSVELFLLFHLCFFEGVLFWVGDSAPFDRVSPVLPPSNIDRHALPLKILLAIQYAMLHTIHITTVAVNMCLFTSMNPCKVIVYTDGNLIFCFLLRICCNGLIFRLLTLLRPLIFPFI